MTGPIRKVRKIESTASLSPTGAATHGQKRRVAAYVWRCNRKYDGDAPCDTPNLREEEIEAAFVTAFNQLLGNKARYIAHFEELLPLLADTSNLNAQLDALHAQHEELMSRLQLCIAENARKVQDQETYSHHYNELRRECEGIEAKIAATNKEILTQLGRKEQIRRCLNELRSCSNILDEFDLDLWNALVESATVTADRMLTFRFRDGTEVSVPVAEKK